MQTVFEALHSPTAADRPRGEPVRRHSRAQGREGVFWRPFSRGQASRYMLAAERYDYAGRQANRTARNGRHNGPLGHVALDVLRCLLRLVDFRSGRLDPAIATIAERTGRSVAAVVEALKRLRSHGFLDWLRRYEPTGNTGRGPQVRQTSNAYRLTLPPRAEALAPPEAPVSADLEHDHQARDLEAKTMAFDESPLGDVLARIGAAIARRERDSRDRQESPSIDLLEGVAATRRQVTP